MSHNKLSTNSYYLSSTCHHLKLHAWSVQFLSSRPVIGSGPKLGLATLLTPVVIGRKYMPLRPVAGIGSEV
jgi:hypothetical protein